MKSGKRRLEDPKASSCIFYMYFYRATVGEARWRDCLKEKDRRIGNNTTETFSFLVFVNNYKAWLYYEEKRVHKANLLT
jgi:hypothetical protein